MSSSYRVRTSGPVRGSVRPPGSKSITNRVLVCAALATGESTITGALQSDDTQVMLQALQNLGLNLEVTQQGTQIRLAGCGGQTRVPAAHLFVGNSGTTIRFLTAMLATWQGEYQLDGVARMRERPIGDLLDALNSLGSAAHAASPGGCPPVHLSAAGLRGGHVKIRGNISSQYLSGLMLAAPYAREDVTIAIEGELVSVPYVKMTQAVMESFGARVTTSDLTAVHISHQHRYQGRVYDVEPDASAASYFWAAAAITQGSVLVTGLQRNALQGDVRFCECLAEMGCLVQAEETGLRVTGAPLRGIEVNMNDISDTVQTLAAVALFAQGPTHIHDVAHIRHKETDRIRDLARELRKFGATIEERPDGLTIHPPQPLSGAVIETYDDHRMAMSLALVGLRVPGVEILNPGCTAKTYPHFFTDLEQLAATSQ